MSHPLDRSGIDHRGRIGHAATNLTLASIFRCHPRHAGEKAHRSCGEKHTDVDGRAPGPHGGGLSRRTAFAVVDAGALTFAEWDGAANALARRLVGEGSSPASGSASTCTPSWRCSWLVSYSAAHRAGGVAVPMNPRLAPAEVGHVLSHSGAAAVVADGELVAG